MKELLGRPEYLHVLINPILTHALPLVALGLLLALLARSSGGVRIALILVFISAASAWPAIHYGKMSVDRVTSMADETGGDWLQVHRYRAENSGWVFYAVAALACMAFLVPLRWPKYLLPLAWLVLLGAMAACAVAAHIAFPAGKIRHREFRTEPPPSAELQSAQKET